jgi:ADP-heptose:LPS heptosyltransferase
MRAVGIAEQRAPSPGEAVDVLGAARAVVGIDTGLTHLAVQQGTPTVTICRAPAVFFRPWPHARAVVGDLCVDACIAAEKEYAYNARVDLRGFRSQPRTCPVGGRCLDSVQPEEVLAAVESVLRSDGRAAARR